MIRAVLLFPILLLSLYGLGEFVRTYFFGPEKFCAGRIARSLGFGILVHGMLLTLLGFTGSLNNVTAIIASVFPIFLFHKYLRLLYFELRDTANWKLSSGFSVYESFAFVLIAIITIIRGFNALAPNISWDATSHHYLVPSVWLETGRVSDIPSVVFSYYPSLTEMGIAGTMALGTDFLANLYGWLFGIVAVLLLYSIPVRHYDTLVGNNNSRNYARTAGLTAALFFTLFPGVGVQTSGGYVDLPVAVWILFTIDLLLSLKANPDLKKLIAVGLASGAVLATKHIGLLIFPGFIIFLAWSLFDSQSKFDNKKIILTYIATFIVVSLLVPMAWYVRSYVFTGNPFFPFFGEFGLPTLPHPPFTSESWIRPDYDRSIIGFLTYWLYLAFSPTVEAALGRNYSMLFPFLLPLLLFLPKLKPSGRFITILSFFTVLVMYKLFPVETRYHIPFISAIALSFGLLFSVFISNPRHQVKIVFIVLSFLVLASFYHDIAPDFSELGKRYKTVLNLEYEDKYMLRESPLNYGAIHHINHDENWDEMKILCLEPRLYRLKADWVTWFGLKEDTVPSTPEENVAIWYRGGFTHILLGDDVSLKALMYYNIVHKGGWDISGAPPDELVDYLREHPEEDTVQFRRRDLSYNLVGDHMTGINSSHFRNEWLQREIEKELYPEIEMGLYETSRLSILTDPERVAQYSFIRDFNELIDSGGLSIAWTDDLTFLFKCDYPTYLESHPDVHLETLGLE